MKLKTLAGLAGLVLISCSSHKEQEEDYNALIDHSLQRAQVQSLAMAKSLEDSINQLPRTINDKGELVTTDSGWWCSGFFPGVLWYLYENSGDEEILKYAEDYTARVENEKYNTGNHDVGFMLYCSFGNGLRLSGNEDYKEVLLTGANSLSKRYRPEVGLIRSWDHHADRWKYPVIIDNMMNLELMMWAAEEAQDSTYRNISVSHADKTLQNHFRDDFGSYHVVSYNPKDGTVEKKETFQGYADDSTWARGEAWGLYGYTMMYRMTQDPKYLDAARNIASFIINNPNMPEDGIPYWDFNVPDIPDAKRDASAAAIMSSAFIELSDYVEDPYKKEYLEFAKKQLKTLSSDEYLAQPGTNGNFILKHSVGAFPQKSEIDVPLTYADYYFVEALTRLKKKLKQ